RVPRSNFRRRAYAVSHASVADLKFLRICSELRHRNFKSKNHTRLVNLLVSLRFQSSHASVPQGLANFGIGTLALVCARRPCRSQSMSARHSADRSARRSRVLNTTKCESEKLTAKLAAIDRSFATGTGSQRDATTRTVVLVMTPTTPDATNAP